MFPTVSMEKSGWIGITVPRRTIVAEALNQSVHIFRTTSAVFRSAILPATVCVIGELTASMAIALTTIAPALRPSVHVHY